ncbi:hypothetical protein Ciccas_003399 [Cichlidogyrus casuarinus]|uniref:Uncharacterized protein n=1 Tax=Cichlidogyrus casuarinus TaxID=1844966 RepID=A0ABD2QEW7_9PLAT
MRGYAIAKFNHTLTAPPCRLNEHEIAWSIAKAQRRKRIGMALEVDGGQAQTRAPGVNELSTTFTFSNIDLETELKKTDRFDSLVFMYDKFKGTAREYDFASY